MEEGHLRCGAIAILNVTTLTTRARFFSISSDAPLSLDEGTLGDDLRDSESESTVKFIVAHRGIGRGGQSQSVLVGIL
jgi:hypothetical protein